MHNYSLTEAILAHGVANVTIVFPCRPLNVIGPIAFTSSSDGVEYIECEICEDRYKVEDNYKIGLVPHTYPQHAKESVYIVDLRSMMQQDPNIKLKVKETIQ